MPMENFWLDSFTGLAKMFRKIMRSMQRGFRRQQSKGKWARNKCLGGFMKRAKDLSRTMFSQPVGFASTGQGLPPRDPSFCRLRLVDASDSPADRLIPATSRIEGESA